MDNFYIDGENPDGDDNDLSYYFPSGVESRSLHDGIHCDEVTSDKSAPTCTKPIGTQAVEEESNHNEGGAMQLPSSVTTTISSPWLSKALAQLQLLEQENESALASTTAESNSNDASNASATVRQGDADSDHSVGLQSPWITEALARMQLDLQEEEEEENEGGNGSNVNHGAGRDNNNVVETLVFSDDENSSSDADDDNEVNNEQHRQEQGMSAAQLLEALAEFKKHSARYATIDDATLLQCLQTGSGGNCSADDSGGAGVSVSSSCGAEGAVSFNSEVPVGTRWYEDVEEFVMIDDDD